MKEAIVIGAGVVGKTIQTIGQKTIGQNNEEENDVTIITPNEIYPYRNYYNPPPVFQNVGKQIVCKGKHKYYSKDVLENNVTTREWVCNCGRKTTD